MIRPIRIENVTVSGGLYGRTASIEFSDDPGPKSPLRFTDLPDDMQAAIRAWIEEDR